jgi:hypothetical protein
MNPKKSLKSRYSLGSFTSGKYYSTIELNGTQSDIDILNGTQSNSNQGYVWVPYIISTVTQITIEKPSRIDKLKKLIKES